MKIICDSCGTKYSISDDKVRGKVFKIRCKKCSHIIVVRGGESGAEEAAPAPAAEGGGWHIVVEGEQVGPIADADVRGRIERGEIKGDTYIWKEGFADWLKISAVPEFSDLVAVESAPIAVGGDVFASDSAAPQPTNGAERSGGRRRSGAARPLFGNGSEGDVFAAPVAASAPADGGLFGSATHSPASESRWPASGGGGGGGGGGMSASHHDGGRVDNLTGQRHENSVLFSLSNLQSLAMPSAKPAVSMGGSSPVPTTEGSGLIDIRAMAANSGVARAADGRLGGSPAEDDLPAFGSFSPAAPVLLPLPSSSGPPKWIYAVIVAMIGLVGVVGYLAFKVIMPKPAPVVVVQAPPAPAPAEPAKTVVAAKEPGAPAIPDDKLPPREPGDGTGTSSASGKDARDGKDSKDKSSRKTSRSKDKDKKAVASDDKKGGDKAPEKQIAEPPKPAPGSIDALLAGATKSGGGGRPKVSDDDKKGGGGGESSAGPLARGAVVSGMNALKPKVQDCYNQFKVPGMATFNFVIGKNGKVSSSTVTGKFAGTPTGACVEKAIKTATFPPSDGLSASYAFPLK
jgi:predicted Zn finger-like uncharacterized protein